jgi:hypothetical protein
LEYWEVNPPFANRQQIKENLVLSRPYLLPNYHGTYWAYKNLAKTDHSKLWKLTEVSG